MGKLELKNFMSQFLSTKQIDYFLLHPKMKEENVHLKRVSYLWQILWEYEEGTHSRNERLTETRLVLSRGQFLKWFCTPTPNFRPLRTTFKKLFTGAKVWHKVQKFGVGRKTVYEINPRFKDCGTVLLPIMQNKSTIR